MIGDVLMTGIGGVLGGIGGLFGASAADKARAEMLGVAKMPGLDTGALTMESLKGIRGALPGASAIGQDINTMNAAEMERLMESAYPGYKASRAKFANRLDEYLEGRLPADVTSQVMRSTAGTALAGGFGGSPLQRSLTWRDLGRTSEDAIRYGMGTMMQVPQAFPRATPMNITPWLGPSPTDMISLRSQERQQKMQALMAAAGMPTGAGVMGGALGQVGGTMFGAGLQGLMSSWSQPKVSPFQQGAPGGYSLQQPTPYIPAQTTPVSAIMANSPGTTPMSVSPWGAPAAPNPLSQLSYAGRMW